ncbi:MAG: diadenylate cyclase CdaA [Phycisphaerales bacterium]
MAVLEWLNQLWSRAQGYPLWQIAIELLVIATVVYFVWSFVRGTRAAGALRALIILVVIATVVLRLITRNDAFPRLALLYNQFLGFSAIALVVIFAPELRRALMRIGELPATRSLFGGVQSQRDVDEMIAAVCGAARLLSKSKFGGIIAIERQTGLRDFIEGGRRLDADVSQDLLLAIFWPNNPLHDMGVVMRGKKIIAAGVQFPLADPNEISDPNLGTRHRAAVGLSRVSDALVVVVSEETGAISLGEGGRLRRWLSVETLEQELRKGLKAIVSVESNELHYGEEDASPDAPTVIEQERADKAESATQGGR